NPAIAGKVLVPVLGDQYGCVLERGELQLRFEPACGTFAVFHHQHRFPLDPRDYAQVLDRALSLMPRETLPADQRIELESLAAASRHPPDRSDLSSETTAERNRDKEVHKRRLAALCAGNATMVSAIESAVASLNGSPDDP